MKNEDKAVLMDKLELILVLRARANNDAPGWKSYRDRLRGNRVSWRQVDDRR